MSEIDRTELRRLLDEAELPWTVEEASPNMGGPNWLLRREGKAGIIISAHEYGFRERGRLIVAAANALPDLLEALEEAEGHWDSLDATLIEVQREKLALERAIERVRALHYAADNDSPRTPRCNECQGRAGAHPCGCWAEVDREPVCGHCNAQGLGQRVPWPCPTVQAIGGESK